MLLSIIVPVKDDILFFQALATHIFKSIEIKHDYEIIVVDSSKKDNSAFIKDSLSTRFHERVVYHHFSFEVFPGAARNYGVEVAQGDFVAFLDTKTLPNRSWFEMLKEISKYQIIGFYGKTFYKYDSLSQKIILASTYGFNGLTTLPGTVIAKQYLSKIGYFIPNVRAGEDSDWILRSKELDINLLDHPGAFLIYEGTHQLNPISVLKKWYRNYLSARDYSHIKDHRFIYIMISVMSFIFFAFNWNRIFAGWDEMSLFYVNNITKIVSFFFVFLYFLVRAFFLPLKKGSNLKFILLGGFIPVFFMGLLIDVTKLLAFLTPKYYSKIKDKHA